jgi:hypothetical protein
MLTRVWQELEYRVVVCRVNRSALVFLLKMFVITDNIMKRPVVLTQKCEVDPGRTLPNQCHYRFIHYTLAYK